MKAMETEPFSEEEEEDVDNAGFAELEEIE